MPPNLIGRELNFDSLIDDEQEILDDHYDKLPNTVGLGANSGELRLRIDPENEQYPSNLTGGDSLRIESVTITRVKVENPPENSVSNVTYHAVITGFRKDESGEMTHFCRNNTFLHQMAAMTWVEENVPDFDLYPVVLYDGNEEDGMKYQELNQRRTDTDIIRELEML